MITQLDGLEKQLESLKEERATKTQIKQLENITNKQIEELKVEILNLKVLVLQGK